MPHQIWNAIFVTVITKYRNREVKEICHFEIKCLFIFSRNSVFEKNLFSRTHFAQTFLSYPISDEKILEKTRMCSVCFSLACTFPVAKDEKMLYK